MDRTRRACLSIAPIGLIGIATSACVASGSGLGPVNREVAAAGRLLSRPQHIIKAVDLPREGTQAWFVILIVEAETTSIAPVEALECEYRSGAELIRTETYSAAGLVSMALPLGPPTPRPRDGDTDAPPVYRLLAFRLICRALTASSIDHMICTLRLADGSIMRCGVELQDTYDQRTDLIFPFRGRGLVSQAGAATGGHRNLSGAFALDVLGLAPNFGPQISTASDAPGDYAGFGRPLLSPGAGVVVQARGDRPDQPKPGEVNDRYLLQEDPEGDPGNHLIIDHENGEFSMIAHLQADSLSVVVGQHLAQGQPVGRLGNSGNSFGPHVHYQLQDGPNRNAAVGLPCRFGNIEVQRLDRGVFFTAN